MTTLPTAFIALQGSRVRLDGGVLLVEHADHPTATVQLGHIGALVVLGRVDLTVAAMLALVDRDIGCVLASRTGRMRAAVVAPSLRRCALRSLQHQLDAERVETDGQAARPLAVVCNIVRDKLDAVIGILTQHHRTHDDVELSKPIAIIRALRDRVHNASSIDRARGFEGAAMACYFSAMPALCRGELTTSSRSRRPPQDAINAALSFGYSLLVNELTSTLHARGLDPALGILHPPTDGRPSLALDLVEPLRHAIVDRLVLRAANRRELVPTDFEPFTDERSHIVGMRFTDAGRSKFLRLYHAALCATITDGASAPRPARALFADVADEFEQDLRARFAAPSDFARTAVDGVCTSTSSN